MLEEEGIVIENQGGKAMVKVEKKSACASCSAAHVCHPPEQDCLEADNPVGAVKGQRVRVVVQPEQYLRASIILYGIPIFVFLTTALMGKYIAITLAGEAYSDLWAFAVACLGMGMTFYLIIRLHKSSSQNYTYHPVITEILSPGQGGL